MRTADLTATARIRNAAIELFARDGFQKTNVRAIAAAAGVSAALVIHHFGSKDGLRAVCDEFVLEVLTSRARAAGTSDLLGEYLADPDGYRSQIQYMNRALAEDSPAAQSFVEHIVGEAEAVHQAGVAAGAMRESSDRRALAVLNVLVSLATLTMPPALARALGQDEFGPAVLRRLAVPTLELYTYGLYTDDTALRTATAANEELSQS
ncbi:TetR family transcriptional regulator [Kribbella kalugense]|uniref:TetR family transcriptional regulator n=1 Tax=Kribbella kalugense TaxID=2512221 RepID=A0A4R7ZI20_9ACTN|nr:TetR family transcriptional regulator [Kribbella kalugense]TDW15988.1 TetR family transcriptional regulator [Kribbella kalugense]